MLLLIRPDERGLRKHMHYFAKLTFSYEELSSTREMSVPDGYAADHNRILLGTSDQVWERARKAIRDWRMFHQDWIQMCWPYKRLEPGITIAVLAHHYIFYTLNAGRVVYAIDEPNRFGFAYGTLTSHMARGEERFLVERLENGEVWFDLYAISRPRDWAAKMFYPLARLAQRRFRQGALRAMKRAATRIVTE